MATLVSLMNTTVAYYLLFTFSSLPFLYERHRVDNSWLKPRAQPAASFEVGALKQRNFQGTVVCSISWMFLFRHISWALVECCLRLVTFLFRVCLLLPSVRVLIPLHLQFFCFNVLWYMLKSCQLYNSSHNSVHLLITSDG